MNKWLAKYKQKSSNPTNTMSTLAACQTQKVTKEALQKFLGENWQDYADKPEALKLWAEMLSKKEVMISLKVLTREQYENLFN